MVEIQIRLRTKWLLLRATGMLLLVLPPLTSLLWNKLTFLDSFLRKRTVSKRATYTNMGCVAAVMLVLMTVPTLLCVMKMIFNQIWCCCVMRVMITMLLRRLTTNSGLWDEAGMTRTTRMTEAGVAVYFFTFGFNVVRDLWIGISIWITAVRFDRRYDLTADGVFDLSTFLFSIVLFGDKTSPSIFTLRDFVAAIAGGILRRLCSGLCSVSLYTVIGCREFGDITIDGSHYGLAGSRHLHRLFYGSETSLLRFHSYLNYTIRRNIWP